MKQRNSFKKSIAPYLDQKLRVGERRPKIKRPVKLPRFKTQTHLQRDFRREANRLLIKDLVKWVRLSDRKLSSRHKLSLGRLPKIKEAVVYLRKGCKRCLHKIPSFVYFFWHHKFHPRAWRYWPKPAELKPKWSWVIIAFLLGLLLARPATTVHGQPAPAPAPKVVIKKAPELAVKRFKKIKPVYIAPSSKVAVKPLVASQVKSLEGNPYVAGQCTAYAWSKRPDLPSNLGNAMSWAGNAQAQGFTVNNTPKAGAIGQAGNHVVYIEKVNKDGTVFVSEQNWHGPFIVSTRTAPASSFTYIH